MLRLGLIRHSSSLIVRRCGERGVLIRFGDEIDLGLNEKALRLVDVLDKSSLPKGIKDVLPAYASVLVKYDPMEVSYDQVIRHVDEAVKVASSASYSESSSSNAVVEIPTIYDGEDLESASRYAGMESKDEVVLAHQNGSYRVYFLGFTGGFPYLGGLPPSLVNVPRLDTPRQIVRRTNQVTHMHSINR